MSIFSPAPHIERLPRGANRFHLQTSSREVFAGTFIGYATFYLIRQNFSLAVPYMIAEYGYTEADLGMDYDHLIQ
ncbi:MAG: hypothetical protein ACLUPK_07595 [Veillonella sp.]